LFRIGGWQWRTGIAALAEIAAGAFAQSLLDLPCHPRVLDLIALDAIASNATAARIAARIAATHRPFAPSALNPAMTKSTSLLDPAHRRRIPG
jgi:hypothetical protein